VDKGQYQNPGPEAASLVYTRIFCEERGKRCEKLGSWNGARKSVLVIMRGGVVGGELADTCGSYRGLVFRCAANW
jgi:hypothetical protein